MKPLTLPLLLALLLLAACDRAPQAITEATPLPEATVAPTATPLATHTPLPTAVPATATPLPTATPEPPTVAPLPSATATPSPSPEPPTAAPSATPGATPRPLPAATTAAVATPAPAADAAILRQQIFDAIAAYGTYRNALGAGFRNEGMGHQSTTGDVDCRVIVEAHDRVLTIIALDVSGSSPVVQNAYATAQAGVASFAATAAAWTDGCRQSLALGNPTNAIHQQQFTELWNKLAEPDNLFTQAYHMLEE